MSNPCGQTRTGRIAPIKPRLGRYCRDSCNAYPGRPCILSARAAQSRIRRSQPTPTPNNGRACQDRRALCHGGRLTPIRFGVGRMGQGKSGRRHRQDRGHGDRKSPDHALDGVIEYGAQIGPENVDRRAGGRSHARSGKRSCCRFEPSHNPDPLPSRTLSVGTG